MNKITLLALAASVAVLSTPATAQDAKPMGFFVTSVGIGDGANLGGIEGGDAHCTKLATAAGSTGRTWVAYLSTYHEDKRGISARDRIGTGHGTMPRAFSLPRTSTSFTSCQTF